ncbi:hypothetical protein PV326_014261 [Microctonus aethiopoides]|nr:hypothetical protein PV326_014261 [Microctonus aethiopoides]
MLQGQYGLGIMIVEGKHANVGQGIFASDIQEGSLAEKGVIKKWEQRIKMGGQRQYFEPKPQFFILESDYAEKTR